MARVSSSRGAGQRARPLFLPASELFRWAAHRTAGQGPQAVRMRGVTGRATSPTRRRRRQHQAYFWRSSTVRRGSGSGQPAAHGNIASMPGGSASQAGRSPLVTPLVETQRRVGGRSRERPPRGASGSTARTAHYAQPARAPLADFSMCLVVARLTANSAYLRPERAGLGR